MKIKAILAGDDTSTAKVAVEVNPEMMTYVQGAKGFRDSRQRFPLLYIEAAMAKYMYLPVTPPVEVDTFSDIPEIMLGMRMIVNSTSGYPDPSIDYWTYQPVDGL
tara:strand:+ start:1546 stop:1860 length:315 start_codon:yes stop_codon:yes gene_type:complete